MNRLHQRYQEEISPKLRQEFDLANPMAVARLVKVVLSTSFMEDQHQDEAIKSASNWLSAMTGRKPYLARARQSIAGFGIRGGDIVGLKVTLRGNQMWEFVDKLISTALPRVKDFQGISRDGFDSQGNYTLGLTEQIIFPEIDYDTVGKIRGLQISFVTTGNDKISRRLLEEIGLPFEKQKTENKEQRAKSKEQRAKLYGKNK